MIQQLSQHSARQNSFPPLISCGLVALGLLTVSSSVNAQDMAFLKTDPSKTDTPRIGQMIVIGNHTLSEATILLFSGHKSGDAFTPNLIAEIRTNIFQKGYFGTHSATLDEAVRVRLEPIEDRIEDKIEGRIEDKIEDRTGNIEKADRPSAGKRYRVVIEVDENDTIHDVLIAGTGPLKPDDVKMLLHLKPGMVYNAFQFRRDYVDIQELYNRHGYAVTAAPSAGIDSKNDLHVSLVVARVTEIQVAKNRKTRAIAVLRELKTRKGDYYNQGVVQRDREALLNRGLFDSVTVEERNLGAGKVGLVFNVVEAKTGNIQGGLSYSASEGAVGTATIIEKNFRGMGETLSMSGSIGTTSDKSHTVQLDYMRPWVDKQGTSMDLSVYDRNVPRFADGLQNSLAVSSAGSSTQTGRFNQQRTGGRLAFLRPVNDNVKVGINFRAEDTRTDPLSNLTASNGSILQNGPLFQIGSQLQHDTRDYQNDPVAGGYQSLGLSLGHADLRPVVGVTTFNSNVFGGGYYGKSLMDLRQYVSLSGQRTQEADRTALAMRLQAGAATGKMPFAEQYFLGGTDTLRGYREDRFWGNYMMAGTLELRQPLAHALKGVLFVDAGEAWGGNYSNVNLQGFAQSAFQPHVGAGFGLRVGTPFGPLRLDLGFGSEGARGHIGFGHNF